MVSSQPIELVCLGTSTGGPNALAEVFAALPRNLPVPIVIVQHMPVLFTKMLADRLDKLGSVRFAEGVEGQELEPGWAYIAPGGRHMEVVRKGGALRLRLNDQPPENSCRPAVDVLFRSVSAACGGNVLAVVLTGMGQDGLHGCRQLREQHAQVLAQDEASSVVWGMQAKLRRQAWLTGCCPCARSPGKFFVASLAFRRAPMTSQACLAMSVLAAIDFEFVSALAYSQAAIVLERAKNNLVESRFDASGPEGGLQIPRRADCREAAGPGPGPLHAKAVDALTTNETYFFRDFHPFEALRKTILPELVTQRQQARRLTVCVPLVPRAKSPIASR